jgi:hypothetical protein
LNRIAFEHRSQTNGKTIGIVRYDCDDSRTFWAEKQRVCLDEWRDNVGILLLHHSARLSGKRMRTVMHLTQGK